MAFYQLHAMQFHWNWGAFVAPISFGYATHTYRTWYGLVLYFSLAVLAFLGHIHITPMWTILPIAAANLIWAILCGCRAERWVWSMGGFEDGQTFRLVMSQWNRFGSLRMALAACLILISVILVLISHFMPLSKFP